MGDLDKPYESEAEKASVIKPQPLPDDPADETKHIAEEGEPLGGNVA